ncbi:MAG: hypothetical protein P8129_19465 [Anaerolineae bacterium]
MSEERDAAKEEKVVYRVDVTSLTEELAGIQYIVDVEGKRKAVVINLEEWGELWDEFEKRIRIELQEGFEDTLPEEPPPTEEGDELARAALKRMRGVIPITDPELARWLAESPELSIYGS